MCAAYLSRVILPEMGRKEDEEKEELWCSSCRGSSRITSHTRPRKLLCGLCRARSCNFERLPCSLLITIFSLLPLRDVLRSCGVCRLWNALIGSEDFRRVWDEVHKEACLVLSQVTYQESGIEPEFSEDVLSCVSHLESGMDADGETGNYIDGSEEGDEEEEEEELEEPTLLNQWLEVWDPLTGVRTRLSSAGLPPFHPPLCYRLAYPYSTSSLALPLLPPVAAAQPGFEILASAEGLVCGRLQDEPGYALAVGNPLTRKWRKLPLVPDPPLFPGCSTLGALMLVDSHLLAGRSTYKVALFPRYIFPIDIIEHPSKRLANIYFWLLVYDSEEDQWEHALQFEWSSSCCFTQTIPPGFPFLFELPCDEYIRVAVYSSASRSWNAVVEAKLPAEIYGGCPCLAYRAFPYKGSCIAIEIRANYRGRSLICTALALEPQSKGFKMLSTMATRLGTKWHAYTQWQDLDEYPFELVMEGNFIVARLDWRDADVWPLMAFNLALSKWTRMQKVCHPKFSYKNSLTLSPKLSVVP